MLKPWPEKSREQQIRDEFSSLGNGMSTARFAQHCLDAGFWSEDEQRGFILRNAQSEVRKALKKHDASGLPFAGQTVHNDEDGGAIWAPRLMWFFDDYTLNVGELVTQRNTLHLEAIALAEECFTRFGMAPSVDWPDDVAEAAD